MSSTSEKNFVEQLWYRVQRKYYWWQRQRVPSLTERGYFSQDGQDRFIADTLFQGMKDGCFVDIGAHDGVTFSNTCFLERERNWHGLAIEPLPEVYAQLVANRKCRTIQGCVADRDGETQLLSLTGYTEMLSGILANYSPEHLQRIEADLAKKGGTKRTLTTACFRLETLLQQQGVREIDYLSIDVEGGELAVLRGIDFQKTRIRCISIENNYLDPAAYLLLKRRGYGLVATAGADEIYCHREFGPGQPLRPEP